jgi:alkyl hydroperoxide reductase subunit AhpC
LDEIKNLRKAYEKYKDKNFEMLSVSLDSSSDAVKKFQHEEQSIPWLNAFVNSGFDNKICKDFEVYSVPKAILVDPKGNIAAIGWDLRGDNLDKTIERFLGK